MAIERGFAKGDLREELDGLGELVIRTRPDADAICWALQQLKGATIADLGHKCYALASLFQDVESRDCEAFELLAEEGIPELLRLYDEIIAQSAEEEHQHCSMFILKMLALYGTLPGTFKVIEAARTPIHPESYMWSVILGNYTAGHPQNEILYTGLSDPLPEGFIAVALLDAANAAILAGEQMPHPFDSPEGRKRLRQWLSDRDPEYYSYAHSSAAALPFISRPDRDQLLTLAHAHPQPDVQMEAAWALGKLGLEEGVTRLIRFCRNAHTAQLAMQYLSELGREDRIPQESTDPHFQALAEFSRWLAHPNELGQPPDEISIVDHRELPWPPDREMRPFWLVKYLAKGIGEPPADDTGVGVVGSVTFCLFSYRLHERPPEHAYAVHCYWEMEQSGLIEESEVENESSEYQSMIVQWKGMPPSYAKVELVSEISPDLKYPQRLVALARANINGVDGLLVLDGDRSAWHPRETLLRDCPDNVVLMLHVGAGLLNMDLNFLKRLGTGGQQTLSDGPE